MRVDHTPERIAARLPIGWIAGFALTLTVVWLTLVFGPEIGNWWDRTSSTLTTSEDFRAWVEGFGAWGPVVFFLAQAVQVIVVPIPGTLFPPVGALAFGPWAALGLSLAGMAIGSAIVFLVARRWGRPLAVRLVGADLIHRYENVMTARGGLLIWLVFLFPLLPDDASCALAGLSTISFRRFMLIATVGRIPAVAAGVSTMAGLEGSPAWVWILAASLFVAVLWAGFRYGRALEARLIHRMGKSGSARPTKPEDLTEHSFRSTESLTSHPMAVATAIASEEQRDHRDRLIPVLLVVVATTLLGAVAGLLTGLSGLAGGIILVWGVALAVVVAWARGED